MKVWINTLLTAILAISCTATDFDMSEATQDAHTDIDGFVTDSIGTPIEHIKITILVPGNTALTVYSASDGKFSAGLTISDSEAQFIDITLEDIDGKENGGEFESKTDRIALIFDESGNPPVTLFPVYRLNPSTSSENNPQI